MKERECKRDKEVSDEEKEIERKVGKETVSKEKE